MYISQSMIAYIYEPTQLQHISTAPCIFSGSCCQKIAVTFLLLHALPRPRLVLSMCCSFIWVSFICWLSLIYRRLNVHFCCIACCYLINLTQIHSHSSAVLPTASDLVFTQIFVFAYILLLGFLLSFSPALSHYSYAIIMISTLTKRTYNLQRQSMQHKVCGKYRYMWNK